MPFWNNYNFGPTSISPCRRLNGGNKKNPRCLHPSGKEPRNRTTFYIIATGVWLDELCRAVASLLPEAVLFSEEKPSFPSHRLPDGSLLFARKTKFVCKALSIFNKPISECVSFLRDSSVLHGIATTLAKSPSAQCRISRAERAAGIHYYERTSLLINYEIDNESHPSREQWHLGPGKCNQVRQNETLVNGTFSLGRVFDEDLLGLAELWWPENQLFGRLRYSHTAL